MKRLNLPQAIVPVLIYIGFTVSTLAYSISAKGACLYYEYGGFYLDFCVENNEITRSYSSDCGQPVVHTAPHEWTVDNGHGPSKSTLYASWTPPDKGNLGAISPLTYGPFKLAYGQRWELKIDEHQKIKVDITPAMGVHQATLFTWWDRRGSFECGTTWLFQFNGGYKELPAILNLILDN